MSLHPDVAIEIPREVRAELVAHAREGAPAEVCGVLAGELDTHTSRVTGAHRAENVARWPEHRYEIDPEEQYEIFERIEGASEGIVGFYHSHPSGPPGPSETDAEQAAWPERSYVIVILGGDDPDDGSGRARVGSWRWTGEEFRRERVDVVD